MRFLGFLSLIFTLPVLASSLTTQIHDIDLGTSPTDEALIFLGTGQVARVSPDDPALLEALKGAHERGEWVGLNLSEERVVLSAESVYRPLLEERDHHERHEKIFYIPTILPSYETAQSYFREMNSWAKDDSQCYNRAHVWTYEMAKRHKVNAMKVFMFFTRRYIREYNFDWWFHVAPFVLTKEGGHIKERVLDRRFTSRPLSMKDWTDIFMRNDAECPEITTYSEYKKHQESQDCYVIKVNMYYYQPLDISELEDKSFEKEGWVDWEVRNAYQQAFGM